MSSIHDEDNNGDGDYNYDYHNDDHDDENDDDEGMRRKAITDRSRVFHSDIT